MLARAVSTAFATPAAAPNTASPPGSARSRPGSARHVASPTRSDRPLPGPHAQVDGRSAAHMPSQPRSAALRQPVARQRPSVLRSGRDRRTTGLHGPSCRPRTSLRAGLRPATGPACRLSAACADRSGTPAPPPRPPAQFQAGDYREGEPWPCAHPLGRTENRENRQIGLKSEHFSIDNDSARVRTIYGLSEWTLTGSQSGL